MNDHTRQILDDSDDVLHELNDVVTGLREHTVRVEKNLARYAFTMLVKAEQGILLPEEFQDLGGVPAVRKAVRVLYDKVMADPELAPYFEGVDMIYLRQQQVKMFLALMGATDYETVALDVVHHPYHIPHEHFELLMQHLSASLDEIGMPFEIAEELLDKVRTFEPDIVNEEV